MEILTFKLDDNKNNWHLEETEFNRLNLFVGISAVGKTRILQSLSLVRDIVLNNDYNLDGIEWTIRFSHNKTEYEWILKSSATKDKSIKETLESFQLSKEASIFYEKLRNLSENFVVFERDSNSLKWHDGRVYPRLNKTESIIAIFSEEAMIAPIQEAFGYMIFLKRAAQYAGIGFSDDFDTDSSTIQDNKGKPLEIDKFKKLSAKLSTPLKVFLTQKHFPGVFKRIKQEFSDIFPFVEDLKIEEIKKTGRYRLFLTIKEYGSDTWIPQSRLSSGMLSTFLQLVELNLAPDGAVILIDEFENSLGINCISSAADLINEYSSKLQFIITSHHPHIINEISWKNWKIVTRKGGDVRVINSTDIPELETSSTLEKYIRLINLPTYEQGIAIE